MGPWDILFLDIDGVLNSEQSAVMWNRHGRLNGGLSPGRHDFCPIAASNLLSLFEYLPNLRIVVSSTWRNNRTIQELDQMMQEIGLPPKTVIGKTPRFDESHSRGREVQDWLDRCADKVKVRRFAIIDDDADDMHHLMPYLKHTSWRNGFMRSDMHDLLHYFMHPWRSTNFYTIEQMGLKGIWTHQAEIFRALGEEMISVKYYGRGEPANLLDQTLDQWALARFEKGSRDHHECYRKDRYDLMRFLGGDRGTSQSLDELTDEDYQAEQAYCPLVNQKEVRMDKVDGMLLWNMHSWDLVVEADGSVSFPIHRHDGSLLKIPMALGKQPVGSPDMKFMCLNGQYAGYCGYQSGWIPQP